MVLISGHAGHVVMGVDETGSIQNNRLIDRGRGMLGFNN
jgi:hypothetical protein